MKLRKVAVIAAAATMMGGVAWAGDTAGNRTYDEPPNRKSGDVLGDAPALSSETFATKAAQGGMAEVELGKLGAKKAQSAEVKQFAQRMITDHNKANSQLEALASKEGVDLPKDVGAEHKAAIDRLEGLSGDEFDRAFAAQMVADHEKTVKLFRDASQASSVDEDLRQFAKKTLPTLEHHKQEADELNSKVRGTAADNPQ
ncbi:MAG TPA: DUF4142 domain-containing protein [Terriglobales bacterium]|nr:DUF4142 domain-containing protein [Terriglobales bacterium]